MKRSVINVDREIMGGTPVFRGTRVPIQTLVDYLAAGDSIHDFLEGFPSVKESQVISVLEEMKVNVLAAAHM
jgi:uncharacterized protein (DUF433 family)